MRQYLAYALYCGCHTIGSRGHIPVQDVLVALPPKGEADARTRWCLLGDRPIGSLAQVMTSPTWHPTSGHLGVMSFQPLARKRSAVWIYMSRPCSRGLKTGERVARSWLVHAQPTLGAVPLASPEFEGILFPLFVKC